MTELRGIKLLRQDNHRNGTHTLISVMMNGGGLTHYKLNEWTKPYEHAGPLCVFNNIDDMWEFMSNFEGAGYMQIYTCLYEPSDAFSVWHKEYEDTRREMGIRLLPKGTILADRVKVLDYVPYSTEATKLLQAHQSGNVS